MAYTALIFFKLTLAHQHFIEVVHLNLTQIRQEVWNVLVEIDQHPKVNCGSH
jgi:hypothetical protein